MPTPTHSRPTSGWKRTTASTGRTASATASYYDAGFYNTPMWNMDPTAIGLKDTTEWADWLDPVPAHVLVCSDSLDLVMSPWWNLSELR